MQIYVNKNGQQLGPFDENAVLEMIKNGQLSPDDPAIRQGQQQWQTLGVMFPKSFQTTLMPTLTSQMNKPRMRKRVVGGIYVASLVLMVFGLVVAAVTALSSEDAGMPTLLVVSPGIAILAYLQFLIVHIVIMFYVLFKMWDSIQDGISTSTGKAIGFLFIPIFSIYWIFKAWAGFPAEYNEFIERHQLNVPRLASSVYMFVPIFALLSILVLPVVAVPFIFIAVISQTSDAVNQLYQGLRNKQSGNNLMVETETESLFSPMMRKAVFGLAGIFVITIIGLAGFAWWNLNPKPGKDDLPDTVGNLSKTQNLMSKGSFLGFRKQFGALYESADKRKALVYDVRNVTNDYEKKVYISPGDKKGNITDSNGNKVGEFVLKWGYLLEIFNGSKKIQIWDLNRSTPTYILPYELKKEGKITSLTEAEMFDFAKSMPVNSKLKFAEPSL